jgi:hypothetical protein
MNSIRRAFIAIVLCIANAAMAQNTEPRPAAIPKTGAVPAEPAAEQRLLAGVKAPDGFKVTLFAGPPVAMYPTCVNESPDGAVFVCVDPNLSLSTLKGVGRVMRLVDTDGDGHADRYTTFAEMDSPRGVVSDGKTVYVMHPPTLTAYRDTNGDGIADESTDIVTGLGFDLDFRGADHTTNNVAVHRHWRLRLHQGCRHRWPADPASRWRRRARASRRYQPRDRGGRHTKHLRRRHRSLRTDLCARQHQ